LALLAGSHGSAGHHAYAIVVFIVPVFVPPHLSTEAHVGDPHLEDITDAVDEVVVRFPVILLVALQLSLLGRGPVVIDEIHEVVFDVSACVEYEEVWLRPLSVDPESGMYGVIPRLGIAFLGNCTPELLRCKPLPDSVTRGSFILISGTINDS